MFKDQKRKRLFSQPLGWRVWGSIILLVYLLSQLITGYAYPKAINVGLEVTLPLIVNLLLDVASEFGVLAVLFGLCFFTLIVGLRMVLRPAAHRTKF